MHPAHPTLTLPRQFDTGWRRRNARSVPPPHRRWRSVLDSESTWLRQILANIYQAKLVSFKGPGLDLGFPPLYLSPGLRTFRRAGPKSPADLRRTLLFSIFFNFLTFQNVFQNLLRKIIEKSVKIEVFGLPKPSPNPSKTPPKSMSQQTCDFSSILVRNLLLVARANIKKTSPHAVFC